jgi:Kdo2-lipid IVA lauroyltransferase/acyltransferase
LSSSGPEADGGAARRASAGQRAAVWAVRRLVSAANRAPRERALAVAGSFGRAWARFGGPRTALARAQLREVFPDWSEAERSAVLARVFANLARGFVELATLRRLSREELRGLADVEGLEHYEALRRASPQGGIICLTAHYGSWELLVAVMAAHGIPIAVVHRTRDNPLLDDLLGELRSASGVELLPRGSAARGALRGLREGKVVAMTLDQNASRSEGAFVPFFGRPACTRIGPARLAMRTGAPVVPVFIERIGETARHRVRIQPPLPLVPEGDDPEGALVENVARMTRAVEDAIRRAPDQWIWTHRRWKTQPSPPSS